MKLSDAQPGDLIEVTWRGSAFVGVLIDPDAEDRYSGERRVRVQPITHNISARFVAPSEVSGLWKHRRGGSATTNKAQAIADLDDQLAAARDRERARQAQAELAVPA